VLRAVVAEVPHVSALFADTARDGRDVAWSREMAISAIVAKVRRHVEVCFNEAALGTG